MTLLLLLAALVLGYFAGWLDQHRKHRLKGSEWWAGWQVGRDFGMTARRVGAVGRPEHKEGAEQ